MSGQICEPCKPAGSPSEAREDCYGRAVRAMPGLNVYFRQPIPGLSILPWRVEATADLRNLLAEGYLPLGSPNGLQAVLVQNPRSFRGGFSFIF